MIAWVDRHCRAWADEIRGGLGMGRIASVLDQTVRSALEISPEAWAVERVVCGMPQDWPWRQVIEVHYLLTDITREQRWKRLGLSERRYRTLLDHAHQVMASPLREELEKA